MEIVLLTLKCYQTLPLAAHARTCGKSPFSLLKAGPRDMVSPVSVLSSIQTTTKEIIFFFLFLILGSSLLAFSFLKNIFKLYNKDLEFKTLVKYVTFDNVPCFLKKRQTTFHHNHFGHYGPGKGKGHLALGPKKVAHGRRWLKDTPSCLTS